MAEAANKAKVTIPTIVHTVEPPAQTRVWFERRTRGEFSCGVVAVGESIEDCWARATEYFEKALRYIEKQQAGR